jgi:N-acetylmuramoyl-L-alanine amidase
MKRRLIALAAFAASLVLAGHSFAYVVDPGSPCAPLNMIVLDPGHGGDDFGAVGPAGIREKDIVLSVALKLRERLKALGCSVVMTRSADVFIPLKERPKFANSMMADVFVSIHANAAPKRDSNGIETFFLSMDATDEEARRVSAFENSFIMPADASLAKADISDITDILYDLANTESHHESSMLAEAIHLRMLSATGREGRGVKQAPFAVLFGSTMPAALVEVGFVSNPAEERLLSLDSEQAVIADAIADGLMGFKGAIQRITANAVSPVLTSATDNKKGK